jgi:two-component system, NtrC family, sensor kinase
MGESAKAPMSSGRIFWEYSKQGIPDRPPLIPSRLSMSTLTTDTSQPLASQRLETAMRFIVEGTAAKTGEAFFRSCAQALSEIFQVQYSFIAQAHDDSYTQSDMLVLWTGGERVEPYTFDLTGTPCHCVFQSEWGIFLDRLQTQFPQAAALATLGAKSYIGVVIRNSEGKAIGNLGIMDTAPWTAELDTVKTILQLFATRVGAEIERSQANAKLEEQELFLRGVYEGSKQPIFVIDAMPDGEFRYVSWNKAAEMASGISRAAIVGKTPEELHGAEAGGLVRQHLQECVASGKSQSYEQCLNFDGQVSWWTTTHNPIQDNQGNYSRLIGTTFEITDRKRANQELESALQELRQTQAQIVQSEKMSSLGQLVAGIAHEINNPVNFIHGNVKHINDYVQDLLDLITLYQAELTQPNATIVAKLEAVDLDFLREDLPKLAGSMKVGTERIREIVRSLRTFSRLDEAEVKPIDIHQGIDSTLMILQHRLKGDNAIEIIKQYGELPLVECFAGQLNQVFMNILANAIDALQEGRSDQATPCQIRIMTSVMDTQTVQISFTDNGAGIPAAIQAKIFDPFFTTKPVGQGTGMGMSISYQIITEKHGGKIFCNSTPGEGTEFVIQIPIAQPYGG